MAMSAVPASQAAADHGAINIDVSQAQHQQLQLQQEQQQQQLAAVTGLLGAAVQVCYNAGSL
jgi:hypothetical protein